MQESNNKEYFFLLGYLTLKSLPSEKREKKDN